MTKGKNNKKMPKKKTLKEKWLTFDSNSFLWKDKRDKKKKNNEKIIITE